MPSSKKLWVASRVVGLLVLVTPVLSWAQSTLWSDLKSMVKQVVRDKIQAVPAAIQNTPQSQQSNQTSITTTDTKPSDLLRRIDKAIARARARKPPDYLYETTSVPGQVVGTWTEMTAGILGTKDQRVAYDNFYQSSVAYAGMVEGSLLRARKAALNNDPATGSHLLETALRYERQLILSDKAAIEAYNGNIDASAELAKGLYEGSKAAAIYGSSFVMGPVGSQVVDSVFDITDFAVDTSDNGLSSATKKLVADKLTEMIFSHVPVNGKTLEDTVNQGVTKALGNPEVYKIVRGIVSNPEFSKAFMSFMAKSSAYKVGEITEDQVNKIIASYMMARGENTVSSSQSETTIQQPLSSGISGYPVDNHKPGLSGLDAAQVLGSATEYNRRDAIQRMVEHNTIHSPLSAKETALVVRGTTGAARSQSIAALAKLIKQNLSGQEVETILGSAQDITDYNRRDAIQALAQAGRFGANGADAGLFLDGATGAARAQSIASFAKSLKPNLTGWEAASILGGPDELKEYDRRDAIQALAESKRLRQGLSGDELAAMLNGTTGTARAQSIDALTRRY